MEVIEDWQGPFHVQSQSSADLPMRGRIDFYFVSASAFDQLADNQLADKDTTVPERIVELLSRVLQGYEIVYEAPAGYARNILAGAQTEHAALEKAVHLQDPRRPFLLNKG